MSETRIRVNTLIRGKPSDISKLKSVSGTVGSGTLFNPPHNQGTETKLTTVKGKMTSNAIDADIYVEVLSDNDSSDILNNN